GFACASGCASGQLRCGSLCADPMTDADNCGGCGMACPGAANATRRCSAGACGFVCNPGYADCDGVPANGCEANLQSDPAHCGACATACAGVMCASGMCLPNHTCREIHVATPTAPSGIFTIDPDGPGGAAAYAVYCDMTTDGGG